MFAGNFAPRGWAFCNGQIMPISQNTALFSILGTTYGGDGRTTFALPNLQGRYGVQFGQGPGLNPVALGEMGGAEQVTLLATNLPSHTHALTGATATMPSTSAGGTTDSPNGSIPSANASHEDYASATAANGSMAPAPVAGSTSATGGSQPFPIRSPYLGLSFIIALQGIFPSRS